MRQFKVLDRKIGGDAPCYIIAEVSCNHEGNLEEAQKIIEAAAKAGADAAKIQTYTADTMTRNFKTKPEGTMWEDMDLYGLYQKAQTPWDWHKELQKTADDNGIHLFSSPFDETAVDFLEEMGAPVYKVASFEIVDIKLLEKIAATGKPVIMSSGMSSYQELDEAVRTLRSNGVKDLAMLQCNSGYPGSFDDANLATIPAMAEIFDVTVGLSDHVIFADAQIDQCRQALAHITPLEAVKLGAKIIEVHLTLDRDKARTLMEKEQGGYDWPFSRTPAELEKMIGMIRAFESGEDAPYETDLEQKIAQRSHGVISFQPTEKEMGTRNLRPSLWVVENVKAGEILRFAGGNDGNIDSIRPGGGLHIRFADFIDGKTAAHDIAAGEPLAWNMVNFEGCNDE